MATINLGAIKFNWQGAYAGGTAYAVDDVVSYNGSSYICKLASTGNLPTNTTYWDVMSQAGTDLTSTLTTQGDILYRDGSGLQRLGAGTSGQFLKTLGTGANPLWADAGGGLQSMQTFETAGSFTWTKPTGINKIKVYVTGGGGGGFGQRNDNDQAGATGGAGGTAIKIIDVSAVSTVSVTVGAGGAGNEANGGGAGGDGSTSSFGAYCSATGGEGGGDGYDDSRSGGKGGSATGGDLNLTGGSGMSGTYTGTNNPNPTGIIGAASFWGGAGGSFGNVVYSGKSTPNLDGFHGAGGGASCITNGSIGGDGGTGLIVVEEYK